MERAFTTQDGTECRVAVDDGRVFVAAHGQQVDVHITADGITVQITKGNDVLAEATTDADA